MAKRNYRKSSKKIQPAVETLTFALGNTSQASQDPGVLPGQSTYYCDLSQVTSLANRRFYRQGLNWAVGGFRVNSTNVVKGGQQIVADSPNGAITIQKLPHTWVMSNAWEKSFRAWTRMNNEALQGTESVKPKFLDYKIYMDSQHHQSGFSKNLLPAVADTGFTTPTAGYVDATPGEWSASKVIIPDSAAPGLTDERELIAIGENYPAAGASGLRAVSLIEGYSNSRALPDILDPNLPNDADDTSGAFPQNWIVAIRNEGTDQSEEVLDNVTGENNIAPYPFENDGVHTDTMYPGGPDQLNGLQMHTIENITGSTVGGVTYLRGGSFPCGLIRIDIFNNDQTYEMLNLLQIDLVPGTHRGYLAEPMTDM